MNNLDEIVQTIINYNYIAFDPLKSTTSVPFGPSISTDNALINTQNLSEIVQSFLDGHIKKLSSMRSAYLQFARGDKSTDSKTFEKIIKQFDTLIDEYTAISNALVSDLSDINTTQQEMDSLLKQYNDVQIEISNKKIGVSDSMLNASLNANNIKQIGTLYKKGQKIQTKFDKMKQELSKLVDVFRTINLTLSSNTITYKGNVDVPRTTINFDQDLKELTKLLQIDEATKVKQSIMQNELNSIMRLEALGPIDTKLNTSFVPVKVKIPLTTIPPPPPPQSEDILMQDISVERSMEIQLNKISTEFDLQLENLKEKIRDLYYLEIFDNNSEAVYAKNYATNFEMIEIELNDLKIETLKLIDNELQRATANLDLETMAEKLKNKIDRSNVQTLFDLIEYRPEKTFLIDNIYPFIRGDDIDFDGKSLQVTYIDPDYEGKRSKIEIPVSEFENYTKSKSVFIKRNNLPGKDKRLIIKLGNYRWDNSKLIATT